jgi:pyridine nucleotide-disulfide oxidoreductase family protein
LKRLVLLGGGHAHIEVLRVLADQPVAGWEITLVSPFERQLYSGMVPGVVAGHYQLDECAIDLAALARRAGASFPRTSAALVDASRREVALADGTSVAYDLLSLNIGSIVVAGSVRGVDKHAILIRPLEAALDAWSKVRERSQRGKVHSITLVGAGAAGVELALAMAHRLHADLGQAAPHVRVIGDAQPLAQIARGARASLLRALRERGIGMHAGHAVKEVAADFVQLEGGMEFASDATFWTTGPAAPDLARDSGFATDPHGYLLTDGFLRSESHPEVFGAGDCATQRGRPRPKAGVFAVRAAPVLAANLRAAMTGGKLAAHATGRRYLALISMGGREAVGFWNGFSWRGEWAWRWKDRIDRRFVARYAA